MNFSRHEYEGNEEELARIDEFESDYQKDRTIWWFTRQCFSSKVNFNIRKRKSSIHSIFDLDVKQSSLYT